MAISFDEKRKTYYVNMKQIQPDGSVKWVKKRGFRTKREAKAWEAEAHKAVQEAKTVSPTFRAMISEWEAYSQSSAEVKIKHREHFEKRFSEFLDRPIGEITKAELIQWRGLLADQEVSTKTKNITIQFVRSVFRYANQIHDLPNTAACIKPLKLTNQELMHEMDVWTPDEFQRFLSCVDKPIYSLYFETLYWTGMRRGEGIAIQADDLKDGWANIHASQRTATEGRKPTKTKQNRTIRLLPQLWEKLKPLAEQNSGYLFGNDDPLSPTMIDAAFRKAVKASGVKKIRIHDLRHSFATNAINNGCNIVAVSKYLGHSTIEQTLKTYTHLLKNSDDAMISTMSGLMK
ncbi:MAG: site-specific integrase [Solobacterium sp.]|nr:site-specific integrase [Solobacterium sp.]